MSRTGKYLIAGLTLVAFAVRCRGLFYNTFHTDEALFASWARAIAIWRDPLLLNQWVDKPPLLFYLQAFFFSLFGPVEMAARLPNFIASLLLVPLTGLVAWRLFANEVLVVLVAAFVAFSPIAIQFSSSAYTDPLMTAFVTSALLVTVSSSPTISERNVSELNLALVSGLLFGLAALTKYQAWLFLPLLIGIAYIMCWSRRQWIRWLTGFGAMLLLLLIWDIARTGRLSLWSSQMSAYGGLRLAWSWELWPRLEAWADLWGYLFDTPVLGFAILLALPPFLALLIYDQDRPTAIDQLFVIYLTAYFILHWFIAVPIWDRYVLPVVPVVGLILTRFVWRLFKFALSAVPSLVNKRAFERKVLWLLPVLFLAFQGPSILEARAGRLPVGGRPGADSGASQIASTMTSADSGTVLYDHWYSWQWRYHLFDIPIYVSWVPNLSSLAEDLSVFGRNGDPRLMVVTDTDEALPFERTVREAGYELVLVESVNSNVENSGMRLYRITSPQE